MFVLTHRPPARITITRSGDLSDAVATATAAAAGKDVIVFGANLAVQCLRAGLLDEIVIHLVPVLLGSGVRLIDTPDFAPVALERTLVDFWSGDRPRNGRLGLLRGCYGVHGFNH